MPTGLDAKTIAKLVTRFGSLPAALEQAKQDPRFEAAFREVTGLQSMTLQTGGDPGSTNWMSGSWSRLGRVSTMSRQRRHRKRDPLAVHPARSTPVRHVLARR